MSDHQDKDVKVTKYQMSIPTLLVLSAGIALAVNGKLIVPSVIEGKPESELRTACMNKVSEITPKSVVDGKVVISFNEQAVNDCVTSSQNTVREYKAMMNKAGNYGLGLTVIGLLLVGLGYRKQTRQKDNGPKGPSL